MSLGYDVSVWERYATELALAFGDTATRIKAVRTAYYVQGFDVDLISDASGFPVWRVRQAIRDGAPSPEQDA
ncbi:hypothetical protein [Microbacterium yannicii]|uniref:hypothetical protein n=1 Tax=Microbacterium yannicii TaxID=671622 RepID=UPI0012FBDBCD|nr:hypothetical protein [Microbacterium yannicii]